MKQLLKITLSLLFLITSLDASAGYELVNLDGLSYDCNWSGYGYPGTDLKAVVRGSENNLNITTANIASSVSFEYYYYLDGNPRLQCDTVTAPVVGIAHNGFSGRKQLGSVIIPNTIESIGYYAFSGCESLKDITLPNSVTTIEFGVFRGCVSLTSVTIPESVTSIGSGLFSGCTNLTSVTIPNSVTSLVSDLFRGCSSLTSVTLPNNIPTIPDYCFSGCSSLPNFTIPNTVTTIGGNAFYGCSSFKSIIIPSTVTMIGMYAFGGCSNLLSVTCLAVTPPKVTRDTFARYKDATLYVPAGSVSAYKDNSEWRRFNIQAISETLPGDLNGDGEVNIGDVNAVIHIILYGSDGTSGDVNGDGEVNIGDVTAVLNIIFGRNLN